MITQDTTLDLSMVDTENPAEVKEALLSLSARIQELTTESEKLNQEIKRIKSL